MKTPMLSGAYSAALKKIIFILGGMFLVLALGILFIVRYIAGY